LGDWNGKVGKEGVEEGIMEQYGIGEKSKLGENVPDI